MPITKARESQPAPGAEWYRVATWSAHQDRDFYGNARRHYVLELAVSHGRLPELGDWMVDEDGQRARVFDVRMESPAAPLFTVQLVVNEPCELYEDGGYWRLEPVTVTSWGTARVESTPGTAGPAGPDVILPAARAAPKPPPPPDPRPRDEQRFGMLELDEEAATTADDGPSERFGMLELD